MKILQLHNHYGSHSGESTVLDAHAGILKSHGHDVRAYTRSSVELERMRFGRARAFFAALYNPASIRKVLDLIDSFSPDLVHIHNLFPLLSPSVLPAIARKGIPIVMTVHNYRLVCPNGLFFNGDGICERCAGGNEWQCLRHNCEAAVLKSLGYSVRNTWARIAGYYSRHVDAFLCLTEFQKRKIVENGIPERRCHVLPNFIQPIEEHEPADSGTADDRDGLFFIGRLNRQKGADIVIEAARRCPRIRFSLAGDPDPLCVDLGALPSNTRWFGVVDGIEKSSMFRKSRALLFASRSYEGFPMVFLEAMQHGTPVIAPRLAGYPEIVRDGENGLLFDPEDPEGLAGAVRKICGDPAVAERLGLRGRKMLEDEYGSDIWYRQYMELIGGIRRNPSSSPDTVEACHAGIARPP
ncbi:MAG: glycosyltransferase family 4 protein [Chlorobiaceae bacterium]|nr:glycosyltransferase family 4 protein [Chlorobiaceae bacterium]